jgi:hypothetical protein
MVVMVIARHSQNTSDAAFDSTYHSADRATNGPADRTSLPVTYRRAVFGTLDNALGLRADRNQKKGKDSANHG